MGVREGGGVDEGFERIGQKKPLLGIHALTAIPKIARSLSRQRGERRGEIEKESRTFT